MQGLHVLSYRALRWLMTAVARRSTPPSPHCRGAVASPDPGSRPERAGSPSDGGGSSSGKRPKSSISSTTPVPVTKSNSDEVAAKRPSTRSGSRPSRPSPVAAAAAAAAAEAEREAIRKKLCYVCLEPNCTHEPGGPACPCKELVEPDMTDFKESVPATTR